MREFLIGFAILILYFILFYRIALFLRRFYDSKSEKFRKLLHVGALFSICIFLFAFHIWWHAVIASIIISFLIFPILHFAERFVNFEKLLVQRKPNEVKWSMIHLFVSFGLVISISKGIFDSNALVIASIFTWGLGDAAAALIGKRFGKHKLNGKMIEGTKSVEGTVAMAITSFLICSAILLYSGLVRWYISIFAAIMAGIVASIVELYTRNGADTITVPLATLAVLSGILWAFGGLVPVWV